MEMLVLNTMADLKINGKSETLAQARGKYNMEDIFKRDRILREFIERINDELFRNMPLDVEFWKNRYQQLEIEKRLHLWHVYLARYEHYVHGEYDENSIVKEVNFLISAISIRDHEPRDLMKLIVKNNTMENEEIAERIASLFQKYLNKE